MKSKKCKSPALVVAVLLSIAVVFYAVSGYFFGKSMTTAADVVFNMTNQRIEWTYAGKDGAGR